MACETSASSFIKHLLHQAGFSGDEQDIDALYTATQYHGVLYTRETPLIRAVRLAIERWAQETGKPLPWHSDQGMIRSCGRIAQVLSQIGVLTVYGPDGRNVLGIDRYGFTPDGIHVQTGTEVAPNNFRADGTFGSTGSRVNPLGFDRDGLHALTKTELSPFGFTSFGLHGSTNRSVDPDGWTADALYVIGGQEVSYFSPDGYNFYGIYPDGRVDRDRFRTVLERFGWDPNTKFTAVFPHGFVLVDGRIVHLATKGTVDPFGFAVDGSYVGLHALKIPPIGESSRGVFARSASRLRGRVGASVHSPDPVSSSMPSSPSPRRGVGALQESTGPRWKIPNNHVDPFGFTVTGIDPSGRRTRSGATVRQSAAASLQSIVAAWEFLYQKDIVENEHFRTFLAVFAQSILGSQVVVEVRDLPGQTAYLSWDTDPPTLCISRDFIRELSDSIEQWVHGRYGGAGGSFQLPPAVLIQCYAQLGTPARIASIVSVLAHEVGHARFTPLQEVIHANDIAAGRKPVSFSDGTAIPPGILALVPSLHNLIEDGRMEHRVMETHPQLRPYFLLMNQVFDRTGVSRFPRMVLDYAEQEQDAMQKVLSALRANPHWANDFLRAAQRKAARLGLPIPQTLDDAVRQEVAGRPMPPFAVYQSLILHSILPCYPSLGQERALIAERYPDVMAALDEIQDELTTWSQQNADGTGSVDLVLRILDVARQHDLLISRPDDSVSHTQDQPFSPVPNNDLRPRPQNRPRPRKQSPQPDRDPPVDPVDHDVPPDIDEPTGDYPPGGDPGGPPKNPPRGKKPQPPGGNTPGGDTPGGDTPGGDTPGGDTPGGDTPGGDTPGGDTPGGDTPGGDTPGGDTPGGDTPGGDTPGGDTPGGDTPGGDTPGGDTPGGDTPGGDTPGGDTPGGDTPGGDTPGGDTPGDQPRKPPRGKKPQPPGGNTPGGDTPGGDTPGGDTPGGDTPGGDTPGGDTPGGDTPGGDTPGGDPGGDPGKKPGRRAPGGKNAPRSPTSSSGRTDPSFLAEKVSEGVIPYMQPLAAGLKPNTVGRSNHRRPAETRSGRVPQFYTDSNGGLHKDWVIVLDGDERPSEAAIVQGKRLANSWKSIVTSIDVPARRQTEGRLDPRSFPFVSIEELKPKPQIYANTKQVSIPGLVVGIVNDVSWSMYGVLNELAEVNATIVTALEELDRYFQRMVGDAQQAGVAGDVRKRRVHCAIMAHADRPGVVSFIDDSWQRARAACGALRSPPAEIGQGTVGGQTYDIMRTTLAFTEDKTTSPFAAHIPRLMVSILDGRFSDSEHVQKSLEHARERGVHTVGVFIAKDGLNQEDASLLTNLFGDNQWVSVNTLADIPKVFGRSVARMLTDWMRKHRAS